jgi:DNA primase
LVANAQPLVDFYFSVVSAALDLRSAHGKAEAVRRLAPLVREVADPVARSHYVRRLALLTQTEELMVEQAMMLPRREKTPSTGPMALSERRNSFSHVSREEYVLALLLQECVLLHRLQRDLYSLGVPGLATEDFAEAEHRAIFQELERICDEENEEVGEARLAAAIEPRLSPALLPCFQHLLELTTRLPPVNDDEAAKDLVDTLLRLRRDNLEHDLSRLRFLLEDAREGQDSEAIDQYSKLIRSKSVERDRLEKALHARTFIGRRRASVGIM